MPTEPTDRASASLIVEQEREQFERLSRELRARQDKVEALDRTVQMLGQEREDQLIESQGVQIAQLVAARDRLQLQTAELEAAVKDVDTHRQLELQRAQFEQVCSYALSWTQRALHLSVSSESLCCSWLEVAGACWIWCMCQIIESRMWP